MCLLLADNLITSFGNSKIQNKVLLGKYFNIGRIAVANSLDGNFNGGFNVFKQEVQKVYGEMQKALDHAKVSPIQKENFQFLKDSMFRILNNLQEINECPSLVEMEALINRITKAGAEAGFAGGGVKGISGKVESLARLYLLAKDKGDLDNFFIAPSRGDGCISGKIVSMERYRLSLDGIEMGEIVDTEKAYFLSNSVISEFIMEFLDKNEIGQKAEGFEKFKLIEVGLMDYLDKNVEDIAQEFENFAGAKMMPPFVEHLKQSKLLVEEGDAIDWHSTTAKIMGDGAEKKSMVNSAMEIIKATYGWEGLV
ncbi:MAG: hypothetical protein ACI9YB_000769 [Halioglobus sp.]